MDRGEVSCKAEGGSVHVQFSIPSECLTGDSSLLQIQVGDARFEVPLHDFVPEEHETKEAVELKSSADFFDIDQLLSPHNSNSSVFMEDNQEQSFSQQQNIGSVNLNKSNKKLKQSLLWSDEATKLFLEIYKESRKLLEKRCIISKKDMWSYIATQMKSKGHNVTAIQAENKYKTLKRAYRNTISNKNYSRNRSVCGFESESNDLFSHKRTKTRPENSLFGHSRLPDHAMNYNSSTNSDSSSSEPPLPSPNEIKTSRDGARTVKALQEVNHAILNLSKKLNEQLENQKTFLTAQDSFHEDLLSLQNQIHEERKRQNDLLETFLKKKQNLC